MSLSSEFEKSGHWLFRYRSFLCLAGVPLVAIGLKSFTYLGNSRSLDEIWDVISFLISLSGLAVRAFTVGFVPGRTSGRSTRGQVARSLNTTGMYSVVRHPLYLGNYLALLGFAVFFHTWYIVVVATCFYALYYERIMFAEESFLRERFGEQFERWAEVTPAVIPNFRLWRTPALPFSFRTVLRREYTGFFVVTSLFLLLDLAADSVAERRWCMSWSWIGLVAAAGAIYLILRGLKKWTDLLDEEGR